MVTGVLLEKTIGILDQDSNVTQCPLAVALQPACVWLCRLCLEPVTSSHPPPAESCLQSHTTPLETAGGGHIPV